MSMNSKLGERLLTEFVMSDAARHFIVQRELRRANRRKRKMSMNSKLGERLLTEFVMSDAARHFIVQRELRRANSGKALCIPIFLWAGAFGVSFLFLNLATPLVGPIAAFSLSSAIAFTSFYTLYNRFTVFLESKLDIDTCKKSDLYLEGAEDFLKSTMKLNRFLRSTMGADGEKTIAENGDRVGDKWPYSKRLNAIEQLCPLECISLDTSEVISCSFEVIIDEFIISDEFYQFYDMNLNWMTGILEVPRRVSDTATQWLTTKWGRRFRIGLLGTTIVAYPIATLISNGPLLKYTFPLRRVSDTATQWLTTKWGRRFRIESMDTIAKGSLGVRFGLYVSLPFYARFGDLKDALDYCRHYLQPLNFIGEPVCVLWDSNAGKEIAESFVLSDKALKFLVLRDLYAHDGYSAYATKAGSWATFTTFSSFFTYWMHGRPLFGNSAISFVGLYAFFLTMAYFGAKQWYNLYR
uniref:Transmembrane protein n=1 Tax=Ascaris lumbricoides TaxID=6252 RepID=A0A0M3INL7_ASCLU